jgi:hypothetical protein
MLWIYTCSTVFGGVCWTRRQLLWCTATNTLLLLTTAVARAARRLLIRLHVPVFLQGANAVEALWLVVVLTVLLVVARAVFVIPFSLLHNCWSAPADRLSRRDVVIVWWAGLMRGELVSHTHTHACIAGTCLQTCVYACAKL